MGLHPKEEDEGDSVESPPAFVEKKLSYSAKIWRDRKSGEWHITVGGEISAVDLSDEEWQKQEENSLRFNLHLIEKYRELEDLLAEASKEANSNGR
ncbi:MAG: hypothetical protein ACXABY_16335 [Candidatus Thorarchaeota archaeon]|jgi:hypothetical protein